VSEKEISEMRPRANAHVGQDTIKSNAAVAREGLVGNLDWSERGTILAEKQSFRHTRQPAGLRVFRRSNRECAQTSPNRTWRFASLGRLLFRFLRLLQARAHRWPTSAVGLVASRPPFATLYPVIHRVIGDAMN